MFALYILSLGQVSSSGTCGDVSNLYQMNWNISSIVPVALYDKIYESALDFGTLCLSLPIVPKANAYEYEECDIANQCNHPIEAQNIHKLNLTMFDSYTLSCRSFKDKPCDPVNLFLRVHECQKKCDKCCITTNVINQYHIFQYIFGTVFPIVCGITILILLTLQPKLLKKRAQTKP
jgi:hypothetical protein